MSSDESELHLTNGSATDADGLATAAEDYSGMLETLDVAIEEAKHKIESGRVYDVEKEKVRIK